MKNVMINFAVLISASLFALMGCSTNTQNENTGIGAVAGAVVGGVAGSAFGAGTGRAVAVGVGAVAGALVGGYVGHSMDHSDNSSACHTLDNNPTNKSTSWHNKKTNVHYSMKPTSEVMAYQGYNYCRKYQTNAVISGKSQTVTGVACKQSDGSWRTIS